MSRFGPPRECWHCHHIKPHAGRGLCAGDYARRRRHGFAGTAPPPPVAPGAARRQQRLDAIEDYQFIGGSRLPDREAAQRLGVTMRTIVRWRRFLRDHGATL